MKYMLLLLGAIALLWHSEDKEKQEVARQKCYAEHQKIAEKILKRKTWWILRPGVITENPDGTGELINFCTAPSAQNDFYKPGLLDGINIFSDNCPDLAGRAKREWPVQPEVRFERFEPRGPERKFLVCNGLLWMRFVGLNSSP